MLSHLKMTTQLYWWAPIRQDSFYFNDSVKILLKHTITKTTIPVDNSDILQRFLPGMTKSGGIIKDWGTEEWDEYCRQCGSVIETFKHIFECEMVKKYFDDLSIHL